MSQARPAIVDHEIGTRERIQQRKARSKATSNGTPVCSGEWVNLPGGEKFYVRRSGGVPYAVSGYQSAPEGPKLFRRRSMVDDMEEAERLPLPKPLFGAPWCEGETAIFFGETGGGKTVVAVQCANDIATGVSTTGLAVDVSAQPVLLFDFELSAVQHFRRYSEQSENRYVNPFGFHPNFIRVEMNPSARVFDRIADYEQFMVREVEREIVESGAKVVIIDNITYLSREQDKVKFALPLMQRLCELKKDRGLSMLVLAHTPKRDESRPMSLNDLAGSRILANFADSVFSIGKSAIDSRLRILKQHKTRSAEAVYTGEHTGVFRFEKTSNFLGVELIGHSHEKKHLQAPTDEAREKRIADVRAMDAAGRSQREIARELQISLGSVNACLKRARASTNGKGRLDIEFLDPERQRAWDSWQGETNS